MKNSILDSLDCLLALDVGWNTPVIEVAFHHRLLLSR